MIEATIVDDRKSTDMKYPFPRRHRIKSYPIVIDWTKDFCTCHGDDESCVRDNQPDDIYPYRDRIQLHKVRLSIVSDPKDECPAITVVENGYFYYLKFAGRPGFLRLAPCIEGGQTCLNSWADSIHPIPRFLPAGTKVTIEVESGELQLVSVEEPPAPMFPHDLGYGVTLDRMVGVGMNDPDRYRLLALGAGEHHAAYASLDQLKVAVAHIEANGSS